jgi:hypothetical protein
MAPRGVTIAACLTFALPAWAEVDVSQFGIQSASEITDPALRDLRMRMVGGVSLTYKQMRTLADAGDGLAAFKTAQALESEDDPALLDDAIHYYAVAARTGRDFAVRRLVSLLRSYEPALKPALQKNAEDALRFQASSGNVIAAEALSDMYLKGKPFGKNIARGMAYMEISAGRGDGKAAVLLAMMYLKGTDGVPADPELARAALKIAAGSTDLGSRTIAENLLRTMPEPQMQPADALGDAAVVQQVAFTDEAPLIRPRPRPAGMSVLVAESLALQPDDLREAAPPRRPAALEQALLQREVSQ